MRTRSRSLTRHLRVLLLASPLWLLAACAGQPDNMVVLLDNEDGSVGQIEVRSTEGTQTLDTARGAGVRVFFLRHLSLPVELAGVYQLRQAMAWQKVARATDVRPWFLRGSPGFELVPELAPRPSEAIFDKITFSAFEGTPLDIALRDCGVPLLRADILEAAVKLAYSLAVPGDGVLLSPACASYDMFRDYRHRGEEFARFARTLERTTGGWH